MKNIVTGTDMKKVDSYTINTIGIPSLVLMERAALSVAEIVCKNQLKDKKILVVAGVGNNGADGVAICRILHLTGYNTELYILGDISKASTEFKQQLSIAHNIGINIVGDYNDADVIIDSIFGVGLSRNVEGVYKDVISKINKGRNIVYSVDIPSGVSADTGKICGVAVKANCTVTFGSYKIGTVLY
ncbi:MAG: NAD(P)H-hydrate epimerase, partial [Eubacterium ventriosum]